MGKRRNERQDINLLAKSIVDQATGQKSQEGPPVDEGKNPAAVYLGRLGGLKGGKARAEKLSAEQRKEIARKAAQTRWSTKVDEQSGGKP
ncbi:MAG: histone H1 [Planctomycetes bacterium]|jgi:hypothetical protein|nr:histone H1 [Planctomycetota bacterium]